MTFSNPNRRRITIAAIAASLVAIAASAFAYAHSGGGKHGHSGHGGSEHHLEHMQAMLTRIGATDVQKSQIEGILKPALDDMKATHQAHYAAFETFHEAITAPSIDRARIEALRADQVKSLDEASKRLVTAIGDAAEALSPEQRAKLAEQIRKHHGG